MALRTDAEVNRVMIADINVQVMKVSIAIPYPRDVGSIFLFITHVKIELSITLFLISARAAHFINSVMRSAISLTAFPPSINKLTLPKQHVYLHVYVCNCSYEFGTFGFQRLMPPHSPSQPASVSTPWRNAAAITSKHCFAPL